MNNADRHIVDSYSGLLEGLSNSNKIELIESLTKSLKTDYTQKDEAFYKSFGSFGSEKPAEVIVSEIKSHRQFKDKGINL